ncbi:fibronectin type III domain-containing protein [Natronorarus salvus]|uniref:fibronectin type III domain-containing protein n=1 Tax=Natronorarus salvus TaxID=3117733 RepID=UPI002F26937C
MSFDRETADQPTDSLWMRRRSYLKIASGSVLVGATGTASAEESGYGAGGYGEGGYGGDDEVVDRPPMVATGQATAITESSATLIGEVEDLGSADDVTTAFEWRESSESEWKTIRSQTLDAPGEFDAEISGLGAETEYEFRAVGKSDHGTDSGEVHTFATDEPEIESPVVKTVRPTGIGETSATLIGEIEDLGTADRANAAFEWREEGESEWETTPSTTAETPIAFEEEISGLTADMGYEFRAVAETEDGTDSGETLSFVTDEPEIKPPEVTTTRASDIDDGSATLGGEVTDLGGADDVTTAFEWREAGSSEWQTTSSETLDAAGTFEEGVSGLEPDTGYEFRATASTDGGSDAGDVVSFVTDEPEAVTEPAIDRFDVTDRSNPAWSRARVEWAVSHEGAGLDRVETALRRHGSVRDAESSSVGGSTADGTHDLRTRDGSGSYTVRITVTDTDWNVTSWEKTIDL